MNWQTFFTRTGTAIVFAIVMLAGLLGPSILFTALVAVVQFIAIKEFFGLLEKINPTVRYTSGLRWAVQLLSALLLLVVGGYLEATSFPYTIIFCMPILLLLLASLREDSNVNSGLHAIAAMGYIALPIALLQLMHHQSMLLPLGLILLIWINDTMAYIVGSFIGKTPFSKISPKKTWEGTIGGALLTVAAAAVWGMYSPYYKVQDWVVLSLCASVAGTLGDLLESKLKRSAGVKDSGSFMPGHGGALDRFDSLLVATPFAYAYCTLFVDYMDIHLF